MAWATGTVTFLFTDIEGSTRLWERYPDAMRAALARHDAILRESIETHQGNVFKTVGDAFYAAFATAPDALTAALTAQRALYAEPWPVGAAIRVRMALHTGAAELRDSDYFGQPLNRVARLLSVGHGGQVLLSDVAHELTRDTLPVNATFQNLGEHRLKDLGRPETVLQLLHPDLPSEFPPLRSLDNPELPNNLPQQLTSFIGRETEMAAIKSLLQKTRLLTLLGTGGCGKTRLSLQVAVDVLEKYPDGVWLVELAPVTDPALVPQYIAGVLNVTEQPGKTVSQTLVEHLKAKRLLLLLDNCEHVLDACAHIADTLLKHCPNVHILATSREGLGIVGEQTYRVPSLSLPNPRKKVTARALDTFEAVRLFVDRATAASPSFVVTNANAPALASVCHHLDGIPLAIELAAARVRSMPIEQIDTRLIDCFRLLTGGNRAALPRQQTLRALIDWSYDLLNASEKQLLCRMSVFVGGATIEAIEKICSGEGVESWEVMDLLTALADKSLVLYEEREGEARYRLLETVRQYTAEKLLQSAEAPLITRQHRDYYLSLAQDITKSLSGSEQARLLGVLEREHDNLRQALTYCRDTPEEAVTGLDLVEAMWRFWAIRGYFTEGRESIFALLRHPETQEHTLPRALALAAAGHMCLNQGDLDYADILFRDSLAIMRELGDRQGIALLALNLAHVVCDRGEYDAARTLYEEALAGYRELEDNQGIASALVNLGNLAYNQSDYKSARFLYEESLQIFREVNHPTNISHVLHNLGNVLRVQGEYESARSFYEQSLKIQRELDERRGMASSLNNLGIIACAQAEPDTAQALLRESLTIRREIGDKQGIAYSLETMGRLAGSTNQGRRAARLWGAGAALRDDIDAPLSPSEIEEYQGEQTAVQQALGEAGYESAWGEGRAMSLEQAMEYAFGEQME